MLTVFFVGPYFQVNVFFLIHELSQVVLLKSFQINTIFFKLLKSDPEYKFQEFSLFNFKFCLKTLMIYDKEYM